MSDVWLVFWNDTSIAQLIPNTGPRYAGWYVLGTEDGFPDGYGAVDCGSLAEGQQSLEEWARPIGLKAA